MNKPLNPPAALEAKELRKALGLPLRTMIASAPEGLDAMAIAELARAAAPRPVIHVARSGERMAALAEAVAFFAPDVELIEFPAWDCLPYDRVSPAPSVIARRMSALARLASGAAKGARLVVTNADAIMQRVPPKDAVATQSFAARPGHRVNTEELLAFLAESGFARTGTVVDPGDLAVRGGIIDLYPPGADAPLRLDFFGDTLESIRTFDPQSQRTTGQLHSLEIEPANEAILTRETISRFRTGYAKAFPGAGLQDPLYEAVTNGRRYGGLEHWLPLFYERLDTLFEYAPEAAVSFETQAEEAIAARRTEIEEYFEARKSALGEEGFGAVPYRPLPPDQLYLTTDDWQGALAGRPVFPVSVFDVPPSPSLTVLSAGGRQGRTFAAERADPGRNVYEALKIHSEELRKAGKRCVIAAWSEGSRDRLETILRDHDLRPVAAAKSWADVEAQPKELVSIIVLGIESGFETDRLAIIAEQDILGDRLVRRARRSRKAADLIAELSSLTPGDLVVHVEHGIGRFEGLKVIEVQGAPHDCLHLSYAGGDRLFLPVENLELLSRFGSDEAGVQLDKLGGGAWQARKAKLKERIREIANELIRTAAARALKEGVPMAPQEGLYDEFCARFPYEETEDQLAAIEAVIADMGSGKPMDRLVCGDVGFGKTEVALRSAFVAAMAGHQVAVVVPTTLLARQHFATFSERFKGLPVKIAQASRLTARKELLDVRKGIESGDIDIVVGTHALLTETTKFRDLGLLIIDEEQHFGVKHKERLKELRANVHVLTLTATPIPRTLQMALTGVRELSLITTPPVDRLAVRTFISPFDPLVVREHLLRELYRGGQSFFIVPRIKDLPDMEEFLKVHVPEVKVAVAHGQLPPTQLEDVMSAFLDRSYDVLLSTTIVESGLDISTANTLIIHRADMFGLAQLYQLRGRVGRSKQRAYALLTTPPNKLMTPAAEKRLKVLQSLDSLGAGFSLASHDLDIRGAGNLLGEEQSGHIKEVGFELYQQMLEEAVANLRSGGKEVLDEGQWSPQINIGASVLLPETYVPDLQVRLGIYRRLADLETPDDLDSFAAELTDRFGVPPEEVRHLLEVVGIKLMCRAANVESIDAGPKGALIGLREGRFANPPALVQWITQQGAKAKLRQDMKIVVMRDWETPEERLKGSRQIMRDLVKLAAAA